MFRELFQGRSPLQPGVRRRRSGRRNQQRAVELLELRQLLTSFAWADTTSITISFAPDGTDIGGNTNVLNAELNGLAEPAVWQSTIVSAFQTWASEVGIQLTVVADSGDRFGVRGAAFGDSRFGDVRIGAVPLCADSLATAIPQTEFISGTWAGDMMLNSDVELTSLDELYALALHEAGHIFGLGHSIDPLSPMFDHNGTIVHAPTAEDILQLRMLYGRAGGGNVSVETHDRDNDDVAGAESIGAIEPNGIYPRFEVRGAIVDAADADVFSFRPSDVMSQDPRYTTVILRTNAPGFMPVVTLLDATGRRVESTIVANGNGLLILQSHDVEGDQEYFVRVESGRPGTPATPAEYDLAVTFSNESSVPERLAKGTLDREKPQQQFALYSAKSQLFNLSLSATASSRRSAAGVILSVYDKEQHLVFRIATGAGETTTGETILLEPGAYTLVVDGVAADGSRMPELEFRIGGMTVSMDTGPLPRNPTGNPGYGTGGNLPYVYPNNVASSRPVNVQRPGTTTNPPVFRPPGWQQYVLYYPWLAGWPG